MENLKNKKNYEVEVIETLDEDMKIYFAEVDSDENAKIFDLKEAVKFISDRCTLSEKEIETVLSLEEEYMKSIDVIIE